MALRVLSQRELLAAHVVELLLDLGLLFQRRELELGVRQDGEQLSLDDLGAVLDQLLLDLPALDRVEIDGDERGDSGTKRKEVLEYTPLDRSDRQPVACDRHRIAPRREQPEDEDDQQSAATPPAIRILGSMRLRSMTRSIAPPLTASERRRAAQLDETHCPPPNSFCPETDGKRCPLALAPFGDPTLKPLVMP